MTKPVAKDKALAAVTLMSTKKNKPNVLTQSDVSIAGHKRATARSAVHRRCQKGETEDSRQVVLAAGIEGSQLVIQVLWIATLDS